MDFEAESTKASYVKDIILPNTFISFYGYEISIGNIEVRRQNGNCNSS